MQKRIILPMLVMVAAIFAAGIVVNTAYAAEKANKGKAQTECPILGGAIDKRLYVDYKGYRIYFCCKGCPEQFMENPEKYMKILRESGVTLEKAPSKT